MQLFIKYTKTAIFLSFLLFDLLMLHLFFLSFVEGPHSFNSFFRSLFLAFEMSLSLAPGLIAIAIIITSAKYILDTVVEFISFLIIKIFRVGNHDTPEARSFNLGVRFVGLFIIVLAIFLSLKYISYFNNTLLLY